MARKGLPKSIIKKYGITKKAWRIFRGKKTSRTRKASPARRKGVKTMARRRKRRRGGKSLTQQAFKWIRVGALVAPAAIVALDPGIDPKEKINRGLAWYTGYYPPTQTWSIDNLKMGWMGFLGATIATYGIPKLASILRRL